jgi:beta-lactamase class A
MGEEGSRKQTLAVLLITIALGLAFYLPKSLKNWWLEFNKSETITIVKPIGDSQDVSQVIGFEAEIENNADASSVITTLTKGLPGTYGIWVNPINSNLKDKASLEIASKQIYTAASVIKLPVLVAFYQAIDEGEIDVQEIYVLREEDRWEYGTGSMQNQPAGTEYTYWEVAQFVANISDNMGAEVLIKKLGGYNLVQRTVNSWGLTSTDLRENETTPSDMGQLLQRVYRGELLTPQSRQELFLNLTNTVNEDRLPAGVPTGVRVVHKFGSEAGVVNDCGIVESQNPYVICVLSTEINAGEAEELLPKISRVVWEWLGD